MLRQVRREHVLEVLTLLTGPHRRKLALYVEGNHSKSRQVLRGASQTEDSKALQQYMKNYILVGEVDSPAKDILLWRESRPHLCLGVG